MCLKAAWDSRQGTLSQERSGTFYEYTKNGILIEIDS